MRQFKSLIQYHLNSALELAREDKLHTLTYFTKMALDENEKPSEVQAEERKTTAA